jgi:RNA polymerase sigma factor (sigma-70 family)
MDPFAAITRFVAIQARKATRQYPFLDAEDLAQDALLRAIKSGLDPTQHTPGECMVYCRRALRYVVLDCLRRRGSPVTASALDAGDGDTSWLDKIEDLTPGPEESVEQEDLWQVIAQKIEFLDEEKRDALKRRLQGQTFEEIGQANGQSPASAHRLVRQAELQLRKSLETTPGCGYIASPATVDLVEAAGERQTPKQMEDEAEG